MSNLILNNTTSKIIELVDKLENEEITQEEYNQLKNEIAIVMQQEGATIIEAYQYKKSLINGFDYNIKRLQELKKIEENKQERFLKAVKENLEKYGIDKITTDFGTITIAKNPMSIEIVDANDIPEEFKEKVETIKVDKNKIKKYIKETGEIIEGIKIIDNKTSLRIK